jgi:hypothetical protein
MSDQTKSNISSAILLVVAITLAATVTLLSWTAQAVYNLHADISSIQTLQSVNSEAIKEIQNKGSPIIQAVLARLDALTISQLRIERSIEKQEAVLEQHTKITRP